MLNPELTHTKFAETIRAHEVQKRWNIVQSMKRMRKACNEQIKYVYEETIKEAKYCRKTQEVIWESPIDSMIYFNNRLLENVAEMTRCIKERQDYLERTRK